MNVFRFQQCSCMEDKNPQFKMDGDLKQYGGGKGFRKCRHHEQHTHYEPINVIDVDVTPTGKGLDHINCYKMFCCNAYYTLPPL